MRYIVYKDIRGEYRWKLVAANGEIVADSAEGYSNRQDCLDILNKIKKANVEIEK